MRALIVEDEPIVRSVLSEVLHHVGIESVVAEDGLKGMEILNQDSNFDFALVDWYMPGMDGCAVVKEVRKNPLLHSLKIMMVTTEEEMEKISEALSAGADEYLMKPFTRESVLHKISLMGFRVPC